MSGSNNAKLVDELGETQDQIAALRLREHRLIAQLGREGVGFYHGRRYRAAVAAVMSHRGGVQITVEKTK